MSTFRTQLDNALSNLTYFDLFLERSSTRWPSEVPSILHDSDSINTINILVLLFTNASGTLLLNPNTENNLLFNATTTTILVIYSYEKCTVAYTLCKHRTILFINSNWLNRSTNGNYEEEMKPYHQQISKGKAPNQAHHSSNHF